MSLFLRILKAVFVGISYLGLLFLAYLVLNFIGTIDKKIQNAKAGKEYDSLSFIERHTKGFLVFVGIVSLVLVVSVVYRFSQYFPDDYRSELDSMREEGYSDGYENGYREGYKDGESYGSSSGYASGYEFGKMDGHSEGYKEGYDDGYDNGYDDCSYAHRFDFDDGVTSGYETGYEDGYSNGYEDCQNGLPYDP